jgi:hypothetical protein
MANYRVVLQGVEPGKNPQLALERLAVISRKSTDALRPLLGPRHWVVKRGVDRELALRYQAAIRQAGWLCAVVPEVTAAKTALPPAPVRTRARRRRKRKTIAAFAIAAAAVATGVGLYSNWRMIDSRVDIAGKWNCLPADRGKETLNYIVAFGNDGSFSMTSAKSYEIQFAGVYTKSMNRISVTLQGGSSMRRSASTIANVGLTGQVVGGSGDKLTLDLAVPRVVNQIWSCTRL